MQDPAPACAGSDTRPVSTKKLLKLGVKRYLPVETCRLRLELRAR